jgi:hypothetical protein
MWLMAPPVWPASTHGHLCVTCTCLDTRQGQHMADADYQSMLTSRVQVHVPRYGRTYSDCTVTVRHLAMLLSASSACTTEQRWALYMEGNTGVAI